MDPFPENRGQEKKNKTKQQEVLVEDDDLQTSGIVSNKYIRYTRTHKKSDILLYSKASEI